MEITIPSNQLVMVECTNPNCHSNIFYMVVRDNTDPICTNFKGSQCPYCNRYTLKNSNGE